MKRFWTIPAAVVCAVAVPAVAGCSGSGTDASPAPQISPVVTASPLPAVPPLPGPTGSVEGIDVSIATDNPAPLKPGGDPMDFTVTLTNTTPADIADVGLVVSLGHCQCGYPGASMMPAGTMRMFDPGTTAWVPVKYVAEGTGVDYIYQNLIPPFPLKKGQTITYRLQMRLEANPDVTEGDSRINVLIRTGPDRIGTAASLPISVQP